MLLRTAFASRTASLSSTASCAVMAELARLVATVLWMELPGVEARTGLGTSFQVEILST